MTDNKTKWNDLEVFEKYSVDQVRVILLFVSIFRHFILTPSTEESRKRVSQLQGFGETQYRTVALS